jgi:hypothetical protein
MKLRAAVYCAFAALFCWSGSVFATSAGAFHPQAATDATYIANYGAYVRNTDSTSAHAVAVDLGGNVGYPETVTFSGVNNGGTITCWVYFVNQSTLNITTYSGTNSTNGLFNNLSITFPGSSGATYSVSAVCSIPPHSANGYSNIYFVNGS